MMLTARFDRMNRHRKVPAWLACMQLVQRVYEETRRFPAHERFGITSQLRRAAVSTATNIAEGLARFGPKEMAHALTYSLGSLAELDTLFAVAEGQGYLDREAARGLEELRSEASRQTYLLYRSFRRAASKQ